MAMPTNSSFISSTLHHTDCLVGMLLLYTCLRDPLCKDKLCLAYSHVNNSVLPLFGCAKHSGNGGISFQLAVPVAGAKDPKALETLVNSMNVKTESVNRDLTAYKGILSKLNAAKELMAELMAREKRKQEER